MANPPIPMKPIRRKNNMFINPHLFYPPTTKFKKRSNLSYEHYRRAVANILSHFGIRDVWDLYPFQIASHIQSKLQTISFYQFKGVIEPESNKFIRIIGVINDEFDGFEISLLLTKRLKLVNWIQNILKRYLEHVQTALIKQQVDKWCNEQQQINLKIVGLYSTKEYINAQTGLFDAFVKISVHEILYVKFTVKIMKTFKAIAKLPSWDKLL